MISKLLILITVVFLFSQTSFSQAGKPDKSFGENGIAKFYVPLNEGDFVAYPVHIAQRKDGKYLVVVYVGHGIYANDAYIYFLTKKGKVDSAFGTNGRITLYTGNDRYTVYDFKLDTADNILVTSALSASYDRFKITRLKPHGGLDKSFGDSGVINLQRGSFLNPDRLSLNILPNGKILLAAITNNGTSKGVSILYQFNENGTPDGSFNGKGFKEINDNDLYSNQPLALQADGKFILGQQQIHRFNADGSFNFNFGTGGLIRGDSVYHPGNQYYREVFSNVQTIKGGGFMCTGNLQIPGSDGLFTNTDKIYTFTKTGKPDTSFNSTGSLVIDTNYYTDRTPLNFLVVQPDSKFLIDSASYSPDYPEVVTRYKRNGKIDKAFGTNGRIYFSDFISQIFLDRDLKIVVPLSNFEQAHPDTVLIERFMNDVESPLMLSTPENVISKNNSLINIAPNPAHSTLNITGLKSNTKLTIINEIGKTVAEANASSNNYNWNIQNLPAGNYFIVVSQNNKIIASLKFIKQ